MKRLRVLLTVVALFVVLVGATFALTGPALPDPNERRSNGDVDGAGELDGLTFSGRVGLLGKPADLEDTLIFADGLFVSAECENRCNYPASPYYVRRKGDRIEFVSELRCLDKDSTLAWRGAIEGKTITGEFTWTSSRWYWTFEKTFWFDGVLSDGSSAVERP